jgi:MoaA/NifB/PqqE/SkfB family radical SAM enzyme
MITKKEQITEANLKIELDDIARRVGVQNLNDALKFPKFFQIETTRLCNARCTFCGIDKWDKSTPMMDDKLFQKIVDEMSNFSDWIEFVAVQRAGEPLIDQKIVQRVKAFKDIGIKRVSISTNASLLSDAKIRGLLGAGLNEIMLSIDSIDKDKYEEYRVNLKYDKVIANIRNAFKVRNEVNPNVIIRVRGVSFYNMHIADQRAEVQRWEDFWDEIKGPHDRIYMKAAHSWGNQVDVEGGEPFYLTYHPCVLPWSTLHVTAMGIVPLCPHDFDGKANLGDINTQSIQEVWQGMAWNKIRQLHETGKRNEVSFCQGCTVFDEEAHLEGWQQKGLYES